MKVEEIPYDYTYCYATDEQCTQTGHCLRRHAAKLNEEQKRINAIFTKAGLPAPSFDEYVMQPNWRV